MAIPHVVALYQWLRSREPVAVSSATLNAQFTREALDAVMGQLKLDEDIFVKAAQLKARGKNREVKDLKSPWFDNLEDYAGLADFIGFIQGQAEEMRHNPSQITLNYLLLADNTW